MLADSRVENWSKIDNICKVEYRPDWEGALRAETIRIECKAVVLYLEKAITFDDVPPLKNGPQAICKIIRQHKKGIHIFISNVLPKPSSSPGGRPRVETNFMLLQAVLSVNRVLKKVHFLTAYEHFISSKGRIIRPAHKYFQHNQQLTVLGCMVFREVLLWEAGLKTYWF